jgi:predicted nuclease with RNAse H fold
MYDSARSDFRRVEEMTRFTNLDRLPSTFNNEMRTVTSVANELCLFLTARIELIDLYPSEIKNCIYKLQKRTVWIEFEDSESPAN